MNNKKLVALLLAAMMSVSTASVAFAAPDDVLVQGDPPTAQIWEGKLYSAMLKAGDEEGGNKDGKLTEGEAAAITSLDVTGLQFGALAGLDYCTSLETLTVTDSQVQDLSFLSKLTSLESLTLSDNKIQDLSALSSLTSLKTLDLSDNASLADLSKLSGLSSLTTLNVSGTAVTDVSKVPASVTDLDISGTSVVDLGQLPTTNLESLKASGNGISDATAVSTMTSLKTLDLSNNPGLLISGIPSLTSLTNLETLNLAGTGISADDEAALKAKLPEDLTNGDGWFEKIVGNPAPDAAEKGVLKSALDEAARLKAETFVSENGEDVSSSLYWVTSEQMATFNSAVEKAQGVYDDPAAAINQAVNELNAAITTFKDTDRQKGSAKADTSSLMTALAEARARKNEVKVSTDGSDIPTTEEWAPEAAHTEFLDAITKADGVLSGANKDTEQSVIDDAVRELNAAMNKFDQAAQSGTKPTTPTPNPDPTPSTSREYSDYYGNEKWDELKDEIAKLIEDGKEGETIEFNATGLPYFPASVARALKGEDITLKVRKNGVTYTINGLEIGTVHKIWYDFEDIESELLTADGAEDETSSSTGDKENPSTGR